LKLPVKTVSSATVTFACMKSWSEPPGCHGVDGLAEKGASRTRWSSGSFQATFPFTPH
jgi:hypothetical protein